LNRTPCRVQIHLKFGSFGERPWEISQGRFFYGCTQHELNQFDKISVKSRPINPYCFCHRAVQTNRHYGEPTMQTNCEQEPALCNTNNTAPLAELKQAYDAGLLVTTVTADMVNDQLLTAVFSEVPPANNLVH
jgi:hypothetical protein